MPTTAPRVSVFMPVYKGEPFLGEAIASVLGQTLGDLELVIVENGSTDRSRETCRAAARADARVRLVEHPRPLGIVGAGNAGVAATRAPLVARQDQDDRSHPRRLERQVAALERPAAGAPPGPRRPLGGRRLRRARPARRHRHRRAPRRAAADRQAHVRGFLVSGGMAPPAGTVASHELHRLIAGR